MNLTETSLLQQLGGISRPSVWAKSVQMLSDHYVNRPDAISPWEHDWAREALLSYFHPLNQSRAARVAAKGYELGFFHGLQHAIDLGCGSAAAALGFLETHRFDSIELVDHSHAITKIAEAVVKGSNLSPPVVRVSHQSLEVFESRKLAPGTLLILSYVLTEAHSSATLEKLLRRLPDLEAIAILEPSTSQDARRLQALRPILKKHGFNLWAPCTHEGECPLLKDSDRDWCHDRLIPSVPSWWSELEAGLPMKNKTVTVSYLLARKTARSARQTGAPAETRGEVRVIGDRLDEKTKVRQMICRGENREFLSWFPSRLKGAAESFSLERGDMFLSHESLWIDPRGIDRSREYRLNLETIETLQHELDLARESKV